MSRVWRAKKPTNGHTIFTMRGREIEYGLQSDEQRFLQWKEEHRKPLWRKALEAAMNNRHEIEKRLALHLGLTEQVWPELYALNAGERTLLIAQVKHMWGLPRDCDCPDRKANIHYSQCSPHKPFLIE